MAARNSFNVANAISPETADELVQDFISLETQDLTQLAMSISRLTTEELDALQIKLQHMRVHMNHVKRIRELERKTGYRKRNSKNGIKQT